jgi:putative transposase
VSWLTARELSGLPGLPGSEPGTRNWLARQQVASRARRGRGGGLEYDCTALPFETRRALMIDQVVQAVPAQPTELATAFVPPLREPQPVNVPIKPKTERPPPSQGEKAVADARMVLVNQVLSLAEYHGVKKAADVLALQLATRQASAELVARAGTANQRARDASCSPRSLQRWLSIYRADGWWGLLPAPAAVATVRVDADVAQVLAQFASRDPQFRNLSAAAIEVTKRLGQPYDGWKALAARARRVLPKMDAVQLIKARHSGAQRAAQLPFKRRDTSMLAPLDVWLIDGHTFKAKVRHPEHGAPFAPEVTLVIDAATRLVCGWSVALSENVVAVGDALRHAVGNCGIPAIIYSDNGAGETAKQMDCPIVGIIARLGAEHRTGLPEHPQGHGLIERSWRTHMINCARQFGSFQGSDVDRASLRKMSALLAKEQRAIARAQETGQVIKLSQKAPSWQQFMDAVAASINEYNTQHRHRALPKHTTGSNSASKHMTPADAWAAMLRPELQHRLSPLELRMMFMPALLRTAKRGELTFLNQVYAAPELMQVDSQQVRVHYDIHDPTFVMVYDGDGHYVCEARWNANKIDYFPKPVVQMGRERRVAARIKLLEGHMDLARRELSAADAASNVFSLPGTQAALMALVPTAREVDDSFPNKPVPARAQLVQTAAGRPSFFDCESDRYQWLMHHPGDWAGGDANWLAVYVASDGYTDLLDYYTSRGLAWKDDEMGFKGAR